MPPPWDWRVLLGSLVLSIPATYTLKFIAGFIPHSWREVEVQKLPFYLIIGEAPALRALTAWAMPHFTTNPDACCSHSGSDHLDSADL